MFLYVRSVNDGCAMCPYVSFIIHSQSILRHTTKKSWLSNFFLFSKVQFENNENLLIVSYFVGLLSRRYQIA